MNDVDWHDVFSQCPSSDESHTNDVDVMDATDEQPVATPVSSPRLPADASGSDSCHDNFMSDCPVDPSIAGDQPSLVDHFDLADPCSMFTICSDDEGSVAADAAADVTGPQPSAVHHPGQPLTMPESAPGVEPAEGLVLELTDLLELDDAGIKVSWPAGYDARLAKEIVDAARRQAVSRSSYLSYSTTASAAAAASAITVSVPAGTSNLPSV